MEVSSLSGTANSVMLMERIQRVSRKQPCGFTLMRAKEMSCAPLFHSSNMS